MLVKDEAVSKDQQDDVAWRAATIFALVPAGLPVIATFIGDLPADERRSAWGLALAAWFGGCIVTALLSIPWEGRLIAGAPRSGGAATGSPRITTFGQVMIGVSVAIVALVELLPPAASIVLYSGIGGLLTIAAPVYWYRRRPVRNAEEKGA